MIPNKPAICFLCKHYVPGTDPSNDRDRPVCRAFPEGIPDEILYDGFDHREQFRKETTLFEKAEGVEDSEVSEWEQTVLETEKEDLLAMVDRFETFEE